MLSALVVAAPVVVHAADASRPPPDVPAPDPAPAAPDGWEPLPARTADASLPGAPATPVYPADASIDPAEAALLEEGPIPDPCEGARTRTPAWSRELWIDRLERGLRAGGCRSALWIDQLFGTADDPGEYRRVSGNVAPSLLWSQYDGYDPGVRFRINLPLPMLDERYRAFVGRTDRDEFVTERGGTTGILPRQFGEPDEEQTLLGLGFRPPAAEDGSGFDYGAGVRLRFPLDPFVKVAYRMASFDGTSTAVVFKPTAFWQQSEGFGLTTRFDVPHVFADAWFGLLTLSATWSERSQGVRGYANATLFRQLGPRAAAALQVGADGESDAEVPVREWGTRLIYRRNVWREWLAIELRTSVTWPRERRDEPRESSLGLGVGFELVFGDGSFRGL